MERKPNENAAEAPDDSLFTSATRVQIPLGTPDNPLKSQQSAETSPASVAGDRGGDSGGLDSNVDAILDVAAVFELINPDATDVPSRIRQLLTLSAEVRRENTILAGAWAELRETIRVMSTNEGKLHARIAELETERSELVRYGDVWKQQWEEMRDTMWKPAMDKLARVEALPAKWRNEQPNFEGAVNYERRCVYERLTTDLEAALKG